MTPFEYRRPRSLSDAITALQADPAAGLLAGGTCIIDLMKQGVLRPTTVIDLNFAPDLKGVAVLGSGSLRIGGATTLGFIARQRFVEENWPLLHETIVDGLTPQLRNAASIGGNIMQRPRCIYFREPDFACNKKRPGSGCAAQAGVHYGHAIFGDADPSCIAVHPSDLCVALTALDASVHLVGPGSERRVLAIDELHRLPGADPTAETTLRTGEIIEAVTIAPQGCRGGSYVKGTEGFTLASCAALLEIADGRVASARLVFGGVAPKPWSSPAAEAALVGRRPSQATFEAAGDAALAEAKTDAQTAFRSVLLRGVIAEALGRAAQRTSAS